MSPGRSPVRVLIAGSRRLTAPLAAAVLAWTTLAGASPDAAPAPRWWELAPVAPVGQGAPLDDVGSNSVLGLSWWKLKVSAKGFSVDALTGATVPASFKTTAYMHLIPNPLPGGAAPADGVDGFPLFTCYLWTEVTPGTWLPTASDFLVAGVDADLNETLAVNTFMGFVVGDAAVACSYTGRLKVKENSSGLLASATLKPVAGELLDSSLDTSAPSPPGFFGSMKISGQTVDVADLPFSPIG